MKLLLRKDISKLGFAGDLVEVSEGYARNYLLPHHLALEPTKGNLKRIEEDKKVAAAERARRRQILEAEAARVSGKEVTIAAAANEEGHLYGSVGPREISRALIAEGYAVRPEQIKMTEHLKKLDTAMVQIAFGDEIHAEVKIWVVREKTADELAAEREAAAAGTTEAPAPDAAATAG